MPRCFDLHGVVFSSAENAKPSYIDGFHSSEHPDLLMSSSPTYRNQTGGISKKGFLARNLFWLLRNTIQMWCAGALAMEDRQDFGMSSFYVMDACKFEHLGGPRFKWNSKHNMDFLSFQLLPDSYCTTWHFSWGLVLHAFILHDDSKNLPRQSS